MYHLLKIDLLDTYIFADGFEEENYTLIAKDNDLEKILDFAIMEFYALNPSFHSFADWEEGAENGGWEIELISPDFGSIFRGSMMLKGEEVRKALDLARKYHYGMIRKGDDLQYMVHIMQISRLLYRAGFEADIIAAGLCHDLLEDTKCSGKEIEDACGAEVLRIVRAVSNDKMLEDLKDWEKKKEGYVGSVRAGGEKAIAVSIADKIVNLEALSRIYKRDGEAIWTRFNRGRDKKLWFEKLVLKMAKENWNHPLVEQYEKLLGEFERVSGKG